MWGPRRLTTLWASTACHKGSLARKADNLTAICEPRRHTTNGSPWPVTFTFSHYEEILEKEVSADLHSPGRQPLVPRLHATEEGFRRRPDLSLAAVPADLLRPLKLFV
jgi:hypothetical protein